jgi:hypothetical protein
MKKITVKPIAETQTLLTTLFTKEKAKEKEKEKSKENVVVSNECQSVPVNQSIEAFYNSLTVKQRIAHNIATEKLGTSYDVTRTHGYLAWLKSQQ